jgi:hypothetical protein
MPQFPNLLVSSVGAAEISLLLLVTVMLYLLLVVSACGNLHTAFSAQRKDHFVQGVRDIAEQRFPPGGVLLVSFPAAANESSQRTRQLQCRLGNQFSDPHIEYDLLQELNEQRQWTIDIHTAGSIIDDNYNYGYKYHSYLILSRTDMKELADRLNDLQSIESWNSRARFLVLILGNIFDTSQQELLVTVRDMFWDSYRVCDILVLVPVLVPGSHDISKNAVPLYAFDGYSWYPYSSQTQRVDSLDIIHVHRFIWENNMKLSESDIFREKNIHRNFHGCPISVSSPLKSYSWSGNNHTLVYSYYEMDVLYLVCEILNLTVDHRPPAPLDVENVINIVTAVQDVILGISELVVGDIPIDQRINLYLDNTHPHEFHEYRWFVPCGRHLSRIGIMSRIFSYQVWIVSFLSFCMTVILIWFLSKNFSVNNRQECVKYKKISGCITNLWAVTLGVSVPQKPRTKFVRILFALFVVHSYAMNTVYQIFFTSFLVDPGTARQILSLEELLESGIEYGYVAHWDFTFNTSDDMTHRKIMLGRSNCTDRLYCFGRVDVLGDFAYFDSDEAKNMYLSKEKNGRLCAIEDGYVVLKFAMYLEKGSYFKDHINYALSIISEQGFSRKLESKKYNNDWYNSKTNKTLMPAEDETGFNKTYFSFSTSHLAFAFYIHILGCSVGLVVFLTEIIFHTLKGNI